MFDIQVIKIFINKNRIYWDDLNTLNKLKIASKGFVFYLL
jgi:hypothetical protein